MIFTKIREIIKKNLTVFLILIVATFLRFYRLEELITFGGDQGIDLLVIKRMIVEHKWTLLGPKTSVLPIYNGPIYYYMLLPLLYFTKLNPISVSYFMIFLWLGAIFLVYYLGKEFWSERAGTLAAFFFSIWPISVEYSRVSFNSFPTPFFASLFLYGLWSFLKKENYLGIILMGLCSGIMMQLHYFNFFLILLSLIFLLIKRKIGWKKLTVFTLSFLVSFSPIVLFELRHQFFNTKNLLISIKQGRLTNFEPKLHYFIAFFPVFFIVLGILFDCLYQKFKVLGLGLIVFLSFFNLYRLDLHRNHGFTMPQGWNYIGVKKASEIIAADAGENFNVAAILDGDTRAHPYRYLIETKGKIPMSVEQYPEAKTLYIIAKGDENFVLNYPVWEIYSFLPAKVEKIWNIQNGISIFKLVKNNN